MTKSKQKQLSVSLDEIKNPHPAILKAYDDANARHLFFEHIPVYVNEKSVFMAAKASKKPIKHEITGLYRKRINGKEYVCFHEEIIALDYFGNVVMHNRMVGRYELPIIGKVYGLNPGMIHGNSDINKMMEAQEREVSIDSIETIHEFEFEAIKPQLLKWKEQNIISDKTPLYVWDGDGKTSKYSKPYTWEEWIISHSMIWYYLESLVRNSMAY